MGGGKTTRKYRSKISVKVLICFLIIGLVPLVVVSFVLITAAHDQMLSVATAKQQSTAADLAGRVDEYLARKTDSVTLAARLYAASPGQADQILTSLLKQDSSLQKVTILTTDGLQRTATTVNGIVKIAVDRIKSDDSTLDALTGKQTLLTINRDVNNNPQITVGQAITSPQSTAQKKNAGGIIANYKVGNEWKSILSDKDGASSYAYVVDDTGNLVYHPDPNVLSTHTDLKNIEVVQNFVGGTVATQQTVSELGQKVVSTPGATQAGWGVIVEEPVSSIYASSNAFADIAVSVSTIAITFSILASLFLSRRLARPVQKLLIGVRRLSQGMTAQKIDIKTKDEFHEIADVLNNIGNNIGSMMNNLKANNRDLTFEQSKLHSIINSVNDGIIAVNRKGEIISINLPAAKLVNQIPYALKGKRITEIFPWKQEGEPLELNFIRTGITTHSDIVLAKGESMAYLDLTVEVLDDETDVAAIITIHDQTASRELSFMKLDFVAIAAHELRTPLTVISGYLDMLQNEAIHELSEFNAESLQRAIVGANQLRALINKLLNIARIERGDMEIFIEKLNLTDLVTKNVEEHQPIAKQKEQTLTFTNHTNIAQYAPADPASIVEVLNNLIGNALKYTPRSGHIQVNLIANEQHVRVEVIDDGPGIPEDLRDKLFTKFYRAERSLIAGTRGTGLGLFISRTIIELQNGTIGIESREGSGSVFYFTLPVYDPTRDDAIVAKNISGGIHGWFKKRSAH